MLTVYKRALFPMQRTNVTHTGLPYGKWEFLTCPLISSPASEVVESSLGLNHTLKGEKLWSQTGFCLPTVPKASVMDAALLEKAKRSV